MQETCQRGQLALAPEIMTVDDDKMPEEPAGPGPVLTPEAMAGGVAAGERAVLARAITLIESSKSEHRALADALLQQLLPLTGKARRIGITGLPGVGKSTFIDQFGVNLIAEGHRVAVLAVDPTSSRTGGSILGDKTRMSRLTQEPNAFIRPSPAGRALGGVTRVTRETMLLCEAAGFDVVLVETVGVGQSESAVSAMVDFFLVLLLPGTGDELQGIKKGLIELADMIAINKADGEMAARATATAADYKAALHILTPPSASWQPPVVTISALHNRGLGALWNEIRRHHGVVAASGELAARRRDQAVAWMHDLIEAGLRQSLRTQAVREKLIALEGQVRAGSLMPTVAAEDVLRVAGIGKPAPPPSNSDASAL
jgi:LAO/AO transport system kinase